LTLRDKFKEKILSFLGDSMKEQNAKYCEQIADNYAIEFANWALNNRERIWRIPPITDEQVLEIFKKEKGL
jgi:hypothetical protein